MRDDASEFERRVEVGDKVAKIVSFAASMQISDFFLIKNSKS